MSATDGAGPTDESSARGSSEATVSERRPKKAARDRRGRLEAGATLGRYRILALLGEGGMGQVYRAHDDELDRPVAIKVLGAEYRAQSSQGLARLQREAQALAKLNHPNVIAIYDVATVEDVVLVAMELVEGQTLQRWLKQERRRLSDVLSIFAQAGRGLAAAHAAGLVHRDFKPANVIVGDDGRVRVLDFGLARAASSSDDGPAATPDPARDPIGPPSSSGRSLKLLSNPLTEAGAIVGTPPFMAPEQHAGDRPIDARSDQFSFCVALYRALYGEGPFAGDDYEQLSENVLAGRMRAPPVRSDVPRWVRRAIVRGLSVDPAARWPSMDALLDELARDPAARRRRIALSLGAIGLAALSVVGLWRGTRTVTRPCRDAAAGLRGLWDASRRAEVRAALAATGNPRAGAVFADVARGLDALAGAWVAMHTEACEATRVQGVQSEELLDLRMQCLSRHRLDLEAEVDGLRHADPQMVQRLAEKPPIFEPLAECADVATLKAAERPPADAAARAHVGELRRRLSQARAFNQLGDFQKALAPVGEVVDGARALKYRPLLAEALHERSRIQERLDQPATALETLREAAPAALAGRRDDLAVDIWTDLVWVLGVQLRRRDETRTWAGYAEAALDRLDHRDVRLARLERVEGVVAFLEKRYDEAHEHAERALSLYERAQPDDPTIHGVLTDLADIARDRARYDEAIDYYTRALAVAERLNGPDHPDVAITLNNRGIFFDEVGRLPEALADYQRALAIEEKRLGPDHALTLNSVGNIGIVLAKLGRFRDAHPMLERVLTVQEKRSPDSEDVASDLINIAQLSSDERRTSEALRYATRVVHLSAALANDELGAGALQVYARALGDVGRWREALSAYEQARAKWEKIHGGDHPELADSLVGLGRCRIELGQPARAIAPLERALVLVAGRGVPVVTGAEARFELARALGATHSDEARAHELATAAAKAYRNAGGDFVVRAERVEAWIGGH
jgi:tetratricopeptide (TPR) repeat protein